VETNPERKHTDIFLQEKEVKNMKKTNLVLVFLVWLMVMRMVMGVPREVVR